MSCPTLPFFSVRDRTIGVGLCKCKQNKFIYFIYWRHLITKFFLKSAIKGRLRNVYIVVSFNFIPYQV